MIFKGPHFVKSIKLFQKCSVRKKGQFLRKSQSRCRTAALGFFCKLAPRLQNRECPCIGTSWPTEPPIHKNSRERKRERIWQTNNSSAATASTVRSSHTGRPAYLRSVFPSSTTSGRFRRWCRRSLCAPPVWAPSPFCKRFWALNTAWPCPWSSSTASSTTCTCCWATRWCPAGSPRPSPSSPPG